MVAVGDGFVRHLLPDERTGCDPPPRRYSALEGSKCFVEAALLVYDCSMADNGDRWRWDSSVCRSRSMFDGYQQLGEPEKNISNLNETRFKIFSNQIYRKNLKISENMSKEKLYLSLRILNLIFF